MVQLDALPRMHVVIAMAALCCTSAVPAAAQDPDPWRVSASVAGGIATPFHGDFDFTATAWQVDVLFRTARHVGVSLMFEEWRHGEEETFTGQAITGPGGAMGRADRVTTRTDHRTRAVGGSLLAMGTAGRVTFSGGGGVSYLLYSRDFTQTMTGCVPASVCADFSSRFDNGAFAGQVQAGVDVAVAAHVAVIGQFRLLVPFEDPGGGHNTFMGGVRVGF